jgi:hypothetical protein
MMVRVDAMGYMQGLLVITYEAGNRNGHGNFFIAGNGGTDHHAAD